jgi:sirohydrochlorin ferrochelatase
LKRGLLLIDRGSREREASEELEVICAGIKAKGDYIFTDYCFLEVEPPYIEDGIQKSLKQDIEFLTIVPYFLYPGKKVKLAVSNVMKFQKDTDVKFVVTKPMSMHKTLINLVENRISTSLVENKITNPKKNIDILIIGHGSKDPNAQMSINYVVDGLKEKYRKVNRCFLELEQPDIFEGIKSCEKDNPEVLVIVFYFLHEGAHVKTDINNDLKPALENSNLKKACITKHLGTDEKMIDLIVERAKEVENAN